MMIIFKLEIAGGSSNPIGIISSLYYNSLLYVAGSFTTIGTGSTLSQTPIAAAIAYLDTQTMNWVAVATNSNGYINDMAIDPSTGFLWAVGTMTVLQPTITGTGAVGYYDPSLDVWTFASNPSQFIIATQSNPVNAIDFWTEGRAIIGGSPGFSSGINIMNGLAILEGNSWNILAGGVCGGVVKDIRVWNDTLFVAGNFTKVGDYNSKCDSSSIDAIGFAALDLINGNWSTLNIGLVMGESVNSLYLTNFSSEIPNYLVVSGDFNSTANVTYTQRIAKWTGHKWESLTNSSIPIKTYGTVESFATNGTSFYVGGSFSLKENYSNVLEWDGNNWKNLDFGLSCISNYCQVASVKTISFINNFNSSLYLKSSGIDLAVYVNWRYWLIVLCMIIIIAAIFALLTNFCWKMVACCSNICSKPSKKEKLNQEDIKK